MGQFLPVPSFTKFGAALEQVFLCLTVLICKVGERSDRHLGVLLEVLNDKNCFEQRLAGS